jgi:hypothetical protein
MSPTLTSESRDHPQCFLMRTGNGFRNCSESMGWDLGGNDLVEVPIRISTNKMAPVSLIGEV